MTFEIYEDVNGDLAIEHVSSGNSITVDGSVDLSGVLSDGEDFDGKSSSNLNNLSSVSTESVTVGDWVHVEQFSSLSSAMSSVNTGGVILLDNKSYAIDSIDKSVQLLGTMGGNFTGSKLSDGGSGSVSLNSKITLKHIDIRSDIDVNNGQCELINCGLTGTRTITVDSDRFAAINVHSGGGDIIFNSGTSLGIVDASRDVSVTDSGSNTIGDIA